MFFLERINWKSINLLRRYEYACDNEQERVKVVMERKKEQGKRQKKKIEKIL